MEEVDDNFDDVYADLETFDVHEKLKKANANSADLRRNLCAALDRINALKAENKALKLDAKSLRDNQGNLLQTARNELRRKDTEIQQLRRDKDDLCFRRARPIRVEPTPAPAAPKAPVSTSSAQTEFTFANRDTVDVLRRSQTHLELSVIQASEPAQPHNRLDERHDSNADRQYHNEQLEWLTAEVQRPFGHRRRSMYAEPHEMRDMSRDARNPLHRDDKDGHRNQRHRDDSGRRNVHRDAENHRDSRPEKRHQTDQPSRKDSPNRRVDKRKGGPDDCPDAAKRMRDNRRYETDSAGERHPRNRRHDEDRQHRADEKRPECKSSSSRNKSREPPMEKPDRIAEPDSRVPITKSTKSDAKGNAEKIHAPTSHKETAQPNPGNSKERTREPRQRDAAADKSIPITTNTNKIPTKTHKKTHKAVVQVLLENIDISHLCKPAVSAPNATAEQRTKHNVDIPANLPYPIVPCEVQLDNLNAQELNRLREAYSESLALDSVISDDVEPGEEPEVWHVSADNGLSKRFERVSGRRDGSSTPNELESCASTALIGTSVPVMSNSMSQEPQAVCQLSVPDSTDTLMEFKDNNQSQTAEQKSDKHMLMSSRLDIQYTSATLNHGFDNVRQPVATLDNPQEAEVTNKTSRRKHEYVPQASMATKKIDNLSVIPRTIELPTVQDNGPTVTTQTISQIVPAVLDKVTNRSSSKLYQTFQRYRENESPNFPNTEHIESSTTTNHNSDECKIRDEETRKMRKKKHDKHRKSSTSCSQDNEHSKVRNDNFNEPMHPSGIDSTETSIPTGHTSAKPTVTTIDDEECPELRNAKKCIELIKQIEIIPRSNSNIYQALPDLRRTPPQSSPQPSTSTYRAPPAAPPPPRPPPLPPTALICYPTSPLRISSDPTLLEELSMDVDYELTTVHDPHRQTNDIISLFDGLETPRKTDPRTYHSRLTDTGQSLITPTPTELMTLQAHGDNSCSYQLAPSIAAGTITATTTGNEYSHQPLAAIASITTRSGNMPELSDQSFLNEILATEEHLFLGAAATDQRSTATEVGVNTLSDQSFMRHILSTDEHLSPGIDDGTDAGFLQPAQLTVAPAAAAQNSAHEEFYTTDRDLSSLSDLCADISGTAPTFNDLMATLTKTPQYTGELSASGDGAGFSAAAVARQSPAGAVGEDVLLEREMRLNGSVRSVASNDSSLERKRLQTTMTSSRATYVVETTDGVDEPEEMVCVINRKTHRRRSTKHVMSKKG